MLVSAKVPDKPFKGLKSRRVNKSNLNTIFKSCGKVTCLSWTTLEEDYILTWGPVLKPVQVSVLLSSSIKTCLIQLVHFGPVTKKDM
jgi:hypothetical protein